MYEIYLTQLALLVRIAAYSLVIGNGVLINI
jgi:hypothetical protein